jgi:hypothetical protein
LELIVDDLTAVDRFLYSVTTGSTNYGKLTNVSILPGASAGAITGANGTGAAGSGADYPQLYEFVTVAVNNNIIRISGGALGFPIL